MEAGFIIAQIFGVLGIVTNVSSMQFKKRSQILIALLSLNLFSALNFIFLNSWSSAYISLFAIVEMLINYLFERKKVGAKIGGSFSTSIAIYRYSKNR